MNAMVKPSSCAALLSCLLAVASLAHPRVVTTEGEFEEAVDQSPGRLVVVSFQSAECGENCELMLEPVLQLTEEQSGSAKFYVIDAEESFEVALAAGIEVLPTIQFYLNGLQVGHLEGPDEAELFDQTFATAMDLAARTVKSAAESGGQAPEPMSMSTGSWLPGRWLAERTRLALPALEASPTCVAQAVGPAITNAGQDRASELVRSQALNLARSNVDREKALEQMRKQAVAQARKDVEAHAAEHRRDIARQAVPSCPLIKQG